MNQILAKAAEALREEAKLNRGVPTKRYAKLRDDLIKAAINHEEVETKKPAKVSISASNPKSPCCGQETIWILGGDQEDCAVACYKCGGIMEFRAVTTKGYNELFGGN